MNKNSGSSGIGFTGVLTIVFVVLKLVGVITWSWWWVLSPTLINIGVWLIVVIIYAAYLTHENKEYGLTSKKGRRDKWKF